MRNINLLFLAMIIPSLSFAVTHGNATAANDQEVYASKGCMGCHQSDTMEIAALDSTLDDFEGTTILEEPSKKPNR